MWTPGETFTDAANEITVTVNAQTATGFQVTHHARRLEHLGESGIDGESPLGLRPRPRQRSALCHGRQERCGDHCGDGGLQPDE